MDCGSAENLKIGGDLTLTAWGKAEDVSGRNRILFGDTAKFGRDRNYSLRIDKGYLRFEHGDGSAMGEILAREPFPVGTWQFIAVVIEGGRYFIYQNDRMILDGQVEPMITPTSGDTRRIGGWFAGQFKGDIDEIRLYKRALSHGEVTGLFGQPAATIPTVQLRSLLNYGRKAVIGDVQCNGGLKAGVVLDVTVRNVQKDKQVGRVQVVMQETRPGSGRWLGLPTLPTDGFLGGEHEMTATVRQADGATIGQAVSRFVYPAEPPLWFGSREGIRDTVLPPFTPLLVAQTPQGIIVSPWGRSYTLDQTPFLSQITSQGKPLLARNIYTWPGPITSGALGAEFASHFKPLLWLGDEKLGLQWICESLRNWSLAQPDRAIEVVRQGGEVILRLNVVTAPVTLAAGERREFVFGLQATPVKPITKDAWDERIVGTTPWYGRELDLPAQKVGGKPALQYLAEKGARAIVIWHWWDVFSYTSPIYGYEEKFRRLVSECHKYNLKVLPYVGGFLLSENAPETASFGDEMWVSPKKLFIPGKAGDMPTQNAFFACQRGSWQDFLVDGIGRLIDDYGIDGVYLDGTDNPFPCRNELHGCGYLKADGSRGSTFPVFSVRDNLRRIYTTVKLRKPDGIVEAHVGDCMNAPALAWATSYWSGEQLTVNTIAVDALPLDRFRTEFMGANWGVPADFFYQRLKDYRKSVALTLLHDVPVRWARLVNLDELSALWRVRDDFGVKQARWLPYWSNRDVVKVEPKDCYASLFAPPGARARLRVEPGQSRRRRAAELES